MTRTEGSCARSDLCSRADVCTQSPVFSGPVPTLLGVGLRPYTRLPGANAGELLRIYVLRHTDAQNFNDVG